MTTVYVHPADKAAVGAVSAVQALKEKYKNSRTDIYIAARFTLGKGNYLKFSHIDIATDISKKEDPFFTIEDWLYVQTHPHAFSVGA